MKHSVLFLSTISKQILLTESIKHSVNQIIHSVEIYLGGSLYLIHCLIFQCFVLHSFLSWKFKFYKQLFVRKYIFNANLSITFKNNNLNVSIFDSFNAKLGGRNAHLEVAPCPIFIIPQKCI